MSDTVIKRSYKLLSLARDIFGGDIIINAWITTYDILPEYESEIPKRFYEAEEDIDLGPEGLRYDDNNIILEFSNGRKIMFSASEWANISIVDFENDIKKEYK